MSNTTNHKIEELEGKIGYSFEDSSLLTMALTHSSYANGKRRDTQDNEKGSPDSQLMDVDTA